MSACSGEPTLTKRGDQIFIECPKCGDRSVVPVIKTGAER